MRRPTPHRPPVVTCALAGLVLAVTGCDADTGTTPAPTATQAPTAGQTSAPTPTGGPMDPDDSEATTGTEEAPDGAPRVLTAGALLTNGDSGAVVRLAPGEEVVLRLTPPLQGATPQVSEPDVLEAVPVQHFADPGYDEFELQALSAGRARVEVRGAGADDAVLLLLVEVHGR